MGNRGQKRTDMGELPADKRACSSLEFRPSSSNSSVQSQINSTNSTAETCEADMETSSSVSASTRSEEEPEKDSAFGSCDSDDEEPRHRSLRDFQRRRSSGDHGKVKSILSSLSGETEVSGQLAALSELCEVLSFCTEDSLSSMMADLLSPVLVKLAKQENNADVMLLAIRAITYLCDVFPRSSAFLVRHDAVPTLCQRLMAIEYLDVAEQCLQALEKISREQPLACLQAGAIKAVLSFVDFFSTSVQRVALSTVVNICKRFPSECSSCFMEAVPIFCNLLQYEDRQLVESVVTCLIKIVDQVSQSSEMLDELCRHGLIQQTTHLINLNGRTTVSQLIYNGLIGLLAKLSSGSVLAFRILYDLNISNILKDILSANDLSHGMASTHIIDGHINQVHEVLKLLNELLPVKAGDEGAPLRLEKESFLASHPDLLLKFGKDILPSLIQVVNSGSSMYVCYGCLSVINKLVCLSKSDMLVELLRSANISSFLAGVFTRKDHHVLVVALHITEVILQKHSDTFLNSFIKEGVFFAIKALRTPGKCPQLNFPVFSGVQLSADSGQRSSTREVLRCLCFAFDTSQFPSPSQPGICKLEKDSVCALANRIRTTYFDPDMFDSEKGLTDILQNLRTFSSALHDLMIVSIDHDASGQHEEKFYFILHQIMEKLNGEEPVSTFEFIESGIMKSLVNYLSDGLYLRDDVEFHGGCSHPNVVAKRFEVFARLLLSSSDFSSNGLALASLIQKLHGALSSLENFPVILNHTYKQRNSFATVPNGRCTMYPCLRVHFIRGEDETDLSDYSKDFVTVDPFLSLDAIEGFLFPKVSLERTECVEPLPSKASSSKGESSGLMETDRAATDIPEMKIVVEDDAKVSDQSSEQAENVRQSNSGDTSLDELDSTKQDTHFSHDINHNLRTKLPETSSKDNASPRLLFFLGGHQLDRSLTLFQAILQQQLKSEHEIFTGAKVWSQEYTITYRRAVERAEPEASLCSGRNSLVSDEVGVYLKDIPLFFLSMCACGLASDLDKSSPTYDVLFLLKVLEGMNRFSFHLMTLDRVHAFAEGRLDNLDNLKVAVCSVAQNEFVSNKLSEKLEQQMRDILAVSVGGIPPWCNQLMSSCPFLFSFEVKCKYFHLAAFGPRQFQFHPHNNSGALSEGLATVGVLPRKKFLVSRDRVLESAARMMDQYAHRKVLIEVEYNEEVGTGLGPTLEFYTLVSNEFQKEGLGMWREDHSFFTGRLSEDLGAISSPFELFPRPWSSASNTCDGTQFFEVLKKFVLLGQIVAKALQDGRVLDLPFSKAFYKVILGQELTLYDIQSFDPGLGRTLLEFQALVDRKKFLELTCGESSTFNFDSCFRSTGIEDLCLDFTLPGYPDYVLASGPDHNMVNLNNLEGYIEVVVDATVHTGINKQVEAFKSGFNQVFPIRCLQIFNEDELEHLLCGERALWTLNEVLDHIKFDHGYTASSPPILNLLEIIQEFDYKQLRAFLQFVTGAPRLPPGGLASLNPKLTIVRKVCSNSADADLPSVMTCANYLKLPPYSSKEKMKEKLLYAITEGQGSFHLS